MPSTDSFTSSAAAVSSAAATLTHGFTRSFTSVAAAVSGTSATLKSTEAGIGSSVFTRNGFEARNTQLGVYVTKATTLGGTQVPLTFPISRNNAVELGLAILQVAG